MESHDLEKLAKFVGVDIIVDGIGRFVLADQRTVEWNPIMNTSQLLMVLEKMLTDHECMVEGCEEGEFFIYKDRHNVEKFIAEGHSLTEATVNGALVLFDDLE